MAIVRLANEPKGFPGPRPQIKIQEMRQEAEMERVCFENELAKIGDGELIDVDGRKYVFENCEMVNPSLAITEIRHENDSRLINGLNITYPPDIEYEVTINFKCRNFRIIVPKPVDEGASK